MGAYGGGGEAVASFVCRYDLEGGDRDVDAADLQAFGSAYGSMTGDANFIAEADINGDGFVDAIDLPFFAEEFGRVDCPPCP
jgi:hypothetical protein